MENKNDFVYKGADAGRKELFSMLIYRPIAKALIFAFFKNSKITPNQISFISLVITLIGCFFFAFFRYPFMILGVLFLHIGYVFDMLDGTYARYKGLSSKFGRWFDPFLDTIKAAGLFISISYAAYIDSGNPTVLLWGMLALVNSLITYYIMNTKSEIVKDATFEVSFGNDIYIGYEISLYLALSVIVLFNILYPGLIFMATVGALSWIKVFITARRYYVKNMDKIEQG